MPSPPIDFLLQWNVSRAEETPTAAAAGFDYAFTCNQASLTADFPQRDAMPHTDVAPSQWYEQRDGHYLNGGWGPNAADNHVIDSRLNTQDMAGIGVRQRDGWYRTAVLGGWRPIAG